MIYAFRANQCVLPLFLPLRLLHLSHKFFYETITKHYLVIL
ncbi:hypothetical protein PROSTU_00033 [Providencia stuartii ATCC 25827]|uniref:Uncharacterized protein n=1 Tax=Providencia stuartii ATCC 25827 TaxID=471874 RepID=A0AA86YPX9_PROST|nr:hypothetical protein PROSTU_00033 [Providencia stuartii ATCC 25827]